MVAGIIGAIANNAHGIAGVVPRVRLMPVRMGWFAARWRAARTATVRMDFAAQAIRYATRNGRGGDQLLVVVRATRRGSTRRSPRRRARA